MSKRLVLLIFLSIITALPLWAEDNTLQAGVDLLHQGKLKEALVIIDELANKYPQDVKLQTTLGYVLMRGGDYERAEKVLRRTLELPGYKGEIHQLLAQIAAQQGDFPLALEEIESALRLSPKDKDSLDLKERFIKEWQIEEKMDKNFGGNFTVTFEGGGDELGSATLAALEDAYVELGSRFELWPTLKTEVILYGNRDFKTITSAPDWVGGVYDGKIRIPVGGLTEMNDNLRRILYHEYAHVLIYALARHHVPLWLNEGLAQWAAGETTAILEQRLAHGEKPLPFSRFEKSFAGLNAAEASLAYAQSLSLTNFLIERFGEAQVAKVLINLGSGSNFQVAAAEILAPWNGSLNELINAWQETLQK